MVSTLWGLIEFNDKVPDELWLHESKKQISLDKYDVEEQNLIKIDLLCNRGLSQLWELDNRPVSEYPIDDKLASKVLCKGDILGLTQSESPTMRKTLLALQPKNVYDMALALALIRPAAADGGRKAAYFRSGGKGKRQIITDEDAIEYISDSLGCSMDFADKYRRGWSKQNPKVISEFMGRLRHKQGDTEQADILKELQHSPKYSYCRGHALSYGQMVWALAYHKARDPKRFWKATLKHCNSSYRRWVHPRTSLLNGNYIHNKIQGTPMFQFEKTGWWSSDNFLSSDFGCEESQGVTYFNGVVANSRMIHRYGKSLVLMTIGYDNNKFVDLIIDKRVFKGGKQWNFISGCGIRKESFNSHHIEVSHLL